VCVLPKICSEHGLCVRISTASGMWSRGAGPDMTGRKRRGGMFT
jgi:hypothetical protein